MKIEVQYYQARVDEWVADDPKFSGPNALLDAIHYAENEMQTREKQGFRRMPHRVVAIMAEFE